MKRVMVIGCPGAGKSTFSRKLQEKTGLPLYYLDMIWHRPDRTNVSREEFDERLGEITRRDQWILDGNYLRTMKVRLEASDTVFLLDYPLEVCLEGAISRIGKRRGDLPWVETELDPEFRQWILDFQKDQMPEIRRLLEQYGVGREVNVFCSREEGEMYLRQWKAKERKNI
ncbi:MAG TPA: adenylate kinase [Candidatus Lachnoclostridium avicola]|nr:adenylate kinase [Candidatus Lachnoclostridium avicola]